MSPILSSMAYYGPSWALRALVFVGAVGLPPALLLLRQRGWRFSLRMVLVATAVLALICMTVHQDISHAIDGDLSFRSFDWTIPMGLAMLSTIFSWAIANRLTPTDSAGAGG